MFYIGKNWSSTRIHDLKRMMNGVLVNRLVDVGCAGGELTVALEPFANEVLAIDPWKERVQRAKENNSSEKIRFIVGYSDDLPQGQADAVTCLEVLEHMPREKALDFLRSLRRLLKPSGLLLLTTPNRPSFQRRLGLRCLRGKSRYPSYPYEATPGEDDYHWYEYSRAELRELLEDAGFRIQEMRGDHVSVHRIRGLGRVSLMLGSRWLGVVFPHLAKHHLVKALAA